MEYSYAVSSHSASAVNFCIGCNFICPEENNLIVVKNNRIEIYTWTEEGLNLTVETSLYGRVTSISAFRFINSFKDSLFVLTERKNFCVLEFDFEKREIISRAKGTVKDRVGKDIENGHKCFIDPGAKLIGMLLYEGLLKVLPIENTGLKEAFNLRIEELRHIDVKFLYGCSAPTFCLLYEDNKACRHLNTYVVDIKERELLEGPWIRSNVEYGRHTLSK
jgi:DNA damage-binding protein 1